MLPTPGIEPGRFPGWKPGILITRPGSWHRNEVWTVKCYFRPVQIRLPFLLVNAFAETFWTSLVRWKLEFSSCGKLHEQSVACGAFGNVPIWVRWGRATNYCNPGNFRIVRKFLEFMKINSLLISIPGLKCTVKRSKLWKLIAYETPKSSIY